MKKITPIICSVLLVLLMCNCTGKFEEFNSNQYQPPVLNSRLLFAQLITCMSSTEENPSQRNITFWAGPFGGMLTPTSSWSRSQHFYTYNVDDNWNKWSVDWYFKNFYPNYFSIERFTEGSGHYYALAKIMRVHIMQIIASMQGPLPYTQVQSGQYSVRYDNEETAWKAMMDDLDYSIDVLTSLMNTDSSFNELTTEDRIYQGDYKKWIKFANSLKLRIAIRISNAVPEYAKEKAEEAVAHPYGVMDSNEYDAYDNITTTNYKNGLASVNSWGEVRANACIVSFMNGYQDPRREAYFTKSSASGDYDYIGVRSGIQGITTDMFSTYSTVKVETKTPMLIFNAAEVAFLRAEGQAVFNFSMGGTAESFYNQGIRLSFEQWGADGVEDYLKDDVNKPTAYTDPAGTNTYQNALSNITIKWNDSADKEEKQERIIVQKWIANWQLGNEAWADFRRTGYPKLIPVKENKSGGVVDSEKGARRMPYPLDEFVSNKANVEYAIANYLHGADNMATDVWWASKK